ASLSFEEASKASEDVVRRLESGEAPLDESMDLYERGEKSRAHCQARLDAAQARIEAIDAAEQNSADESGTMAVLKPASAQIAEDIDASFDASSAVAGDPRDRLIEAMRYAAIGGGKRSRPSSSTATAGMFRAHRASAVPAGTPSEAVHVYSSTPDDPPCMDHDSTRHAQP
ncbi:hypothetical protein OY671_009697, partial [Metschnikowia pulcherrima]